MLQKLTLAAWAAGMLLLLGILFYHGFGTVTVAVVMAGWGLVVVTAFHLLPMICDTLAWRCLLTVETRPLFTQLLWMRWIGESVNALLPAAQIGGDMLRGRLAAHRGVPRAEAAASIVVDLTLSVFTLVVFAIGGVLLTLRQNEAALVLLAGLLTASLLVLLLLRLLRRGLFRILAQSLTRLVRHRDWDRLVGGAAALDAAIAAMYSHPRQLLASSAWALLAWILGAGEIWLALYFLGHPVSVLDALILESLTQAVRSAAFPVPGAWGIQEGGFVLLGTLVAVPAETALATSLIKRVREMGLGIPGLMAWQFAEGRRWYYSKKVN
jgi:putative membrane protein